MRPVLPPLSPARRPRLPTLSAPARQVEPRAAPPRRTPRRTPRHSALGPRAAIRLSARRAASGDTARRALPFRVGSWIAAAGRAGQAGKPSTRVPRRAVDYRPPSPTPPRPLPRPPQSAPPPPPRRLQGAPAPRRAARRRWPARPPPPADCQRGHGRDKGRVCWGQKRSEKEARRGERGGWRGAEAEGGGADGGEEG